MSFAKYYYSRVSRSLLLGAVLFGLVSCGHGDRKEAVYRVTGKVLYQGNPAEGATVTFHALEGDSAKMPKPGGQVQKDGEFRLSTYRSFDGAPAGSFAVTIIYPSADRKENDENVGPDLLRGRYANPKTTPLRAEIGKQENRLGPFDIR
jgi:hypothetical protein